MNKDIIAAQAGLDDAGYLYDEAKQALEKAQVSYLRRHGWAVFSIFHGPHGHYVHSMKIAQRDYGGRFYVLETALSIARKAAQDKARRNRRKK